MFPCIMLHFETLPIWKTSTRLDWPKSCRSCWTDDIRHVGLAITYKTRLDWLDSLFWPSCSCFELVHVLRVQCSKHAHGFCLSRDLQSIQECEEIGVYYIKSTVGIPFLYDTRDINFTRTCEMTYISIRRVEFCLIFHLAYLARSFQC